MVYCSSTNDIVYLLNPSSVVNGTGNYSVLDFANGVPGGFSSLKAIFTSPVQPSLLYVQCQAAIFAFNVFFDAFDNGLMTNNIYAVLVSNVRILGATVAGNYYSERSDPRIQFRCVQSKSYEPMYLSRWFKMRFVQYNEFTSFHNYYMFIESGFLNYTAINVYQSGQTGNGNLYTSLPFDQTI
jgi:hypothetical protein